MDKSWMNYKSPSDRQKELYRDGVIRFLDFAFGKVGGRGKIRCPCCNCRNKKFLDRQQVFDHLIVYGILRHYKKWSLHGELSDCSDEEDGDDGAHCESDNQMYDETFSLIHDITNVASSSSFSNLGGLFGENVNVGDLPKLYCKLMEHAKQELFPGCKNFSTLEFILHLLNIKWVNKWTDKSFTMLLTLLKQTFLHDERFPNNTYEAKKYIRDLGLGYDKIHVCKNECILFRREYEKKSHCPICKCSRYKNDGCRGKKIPYKVLRHFPLIPRLQRLYMSSKIAEHMRWHKKKKPNDGVLRHPADSKAWQVLDDLYPDFAAEERNVRLGLSSDGFNPFGNFSTSYSIWPVYLVAYNLPPWMCMKSEYLMLSLLIPGPKGPGNNIDLYLQPLIEELSQLWVVGVETFDAFSSSKFMLHAALLWTINDFPAYAILSGYSTKGSFACPSCHKETHSRRLHHGNKTCYMRHRRFLEKHHKWRYDRRSFDGTIELGSAPRVLSGDEILEQLMSFGSSMFGRPIGKRKRGQNPHCNWRKISIFFQLPYWSKLLIRHNLDLMHIQKNICDSIIGTVMGIVGKTKDNVNSRLDLMRLGLRKDLHLQEIGDKYIVPPASYTLTMKERRDVCELLSNLKVPDGYSSNIARCVNISEGKVSGMKSHDCHVFMQDILPAAFRGILPQEVYDPLVELSLFFKNICSKKLQLEALESLERNIAITLCKLERVFPPSFFDIMVHLPIHLAHEAKLAGPIQYRWMFPFEREMGKLKSYVRNRAHPEGSIAEGYVANECVTFISMYLRRGETKFNRKERNYDGGSVQHNGLSIFAKHGRPLSKGEMKKLDFADCRRAQLYILRNCVELQPFIEEHKNDIDTPQENFVKWFESRIMQMVNSEDTSVSDDLLHLAQGPLKRVTSYEGYAINGFRFHTKNRANKRKTQNSGVVVKGDELSGQRHYFGQLNEIHEFEYGGGNSIVLFKCEWYDVHDEVKGIKTDHYGVTSVNVKRFLQTDEPYVLASQVEQVFYIPDQLDRNWQVVIRTSPRNLFDMPYAEEVDDDDQSKSDFGESSSCSLPNYDIRMDDDAVCLVRDDIAPKIVDFNDKTSNQSARRKNQSEGFINDNIENDKDDENEEEDEEEVEEQDEDSEDDEEEDEEVEEEEEDDEDEDEELLL